jgi:hypothetical protein
LNTKLSANILKKNIDNYFVTELENSNRRKLIDGNGNKFKLIDVI